jgi:hypothetical protein
MTQEDVNRLRVKAEFIGVFVDEELLCLFHPGSAGAEKAIVVHGINAVCAKLSENPIRQVNVVRWRVEKRKMLIRTG